MLRKLHGRIRDRCFKLPSGQPFDRGETRSTKVGFVQIRILKIRLIETGAFEVSAAQVAAGKIAAAQIGVRQWN